MYHLRRLFAPAVTFLLLSNFQVACSSAPAEDCTPDAVADCTCDDGSEGTQICNAEGNGFLGACECELAPPGCPEVACSEVGNGSVECVEGACVVTCDEGFAGGMCADLNECSVNDGGCDANALCENFDGGFSCTCNEGWDGDGTACTDRDECAVDNGGCAGTCTNLDGTYECTCDIGFVLADDGSGCDDIDECADGSAQCDPNANCNNTPGDYNCTCAVGFEGGEGLSCVDIDECAVDNGGCAGTCTNLEGSFECGCDAGFVPSEDGLGCDDIDECATDNGGCAQVCTNKLGAFNCSCNGGYLLGADGFACDDIDECATDNGGCDSNATCTNFVGLAPDCACNEGYEGDGATCVILPTNEYVFIGSHYDKLFRVDVATGDCSTILDTGGSIGGVGVTPDNSTILAADYVNDGVYMVNPLTNENLGQFNTVDMGNPDDLAVLPDGRVLVYDIGDVVVLSATGDVQVEISTWDINAYTMGPGTEPQLTVTPSGDAYIYTAACLVDGEVAEDIFGCEEMVMLNMPNASIGGQIHRVDLENNLLIEVLSAEALPESIGTPSGLAALDDDTLVVSSSESFFGGSAAGAVLPGIRKIDLNTHAIIVVSLGGSYGPLSIDGSGNIITSDGGSIVRIDSNSGASETLSDSCQSPLGIRGILYYKTTETLPLP